MSPESASLARRRAVEVSGDADVVEGPLQGYHHETYVFPLPGGAEAESAVRVKCREPRSNLLWFDRRCFESEEQLLRALQGIVDGIPEIVQAGPVGLQRFIEGQTLGSRCGSGSAVPHSVLDQIVGLFRQLAGIRSEALVADRRCELRDRAREGDTSDFLERLICFTEERVYQENLPAFEELFASFGVDGDSFKRLRKHVSGLTERPFCLLHADLHRENFIVDPGGRLWTIDWELAMVGDPLYELATHLYLMRYPRAQEDRMKARWHRTVEDVAPGSSAGWEEDLPKLLDYKRAQSVFTDVIRMSLSLGTGPDPDAGALGRAGGKIQKVLAAAAEPLGLEKVPSLPEISVSLLRWYRQREEGLYPRTG
ncbi:phosphotransferase [Streptomyces sp. NPDC057621]|uniref:phosphotransferase n=1 Tax=Streptomyces sp. NPDC057621 TaxID=3346186 RepID=UPI00367948FE